MKEAGARTSEGRSWQPRRAGRLEGGLAKEAGGARAKQGREAVGPRAERSGSGSKF